ncbi:MAG: FAD:protein FMN transferase [Christensenellales bacterium]|jgi:thiamine biosynthesis lipoprotein
MKKRLLSFILALLVCQGMLLVLPSLADDKTQIQKYSYMFFGTFDTAISIIGYAPGQEAFDKATALAETEFNRLHKLFDQYYPYEGLNNIYALNHGAAKDPMCVPEDLFNFLAWCKKQQHQTRGKVNIALGAVLALWHNERDNAELNPDKARLPDWTALEKANAHTSIDDLILDDARQTVFYADPLLKLDVGAVAKGYATELVAKQLLNSEMSSFIINAGGNVRTGHPPLDGRSSWGIGIQDPDAAVVLPGSNDVIDVLYLSDLSLVTSGDYQRYYVVNDKRYHHLIDPDTLMPADFMRSVTIITQDSGLADLLSTAVFLMPFEEGYEFVTSLKGVEAFWILNDRSIRMTPGAQSVSYHQGYRP